MAALKTVVFMGSARNTPTPWGGAKRAGTPVLKFVQNELGRRAVKHEVTVLDPVELKLPLLETPHFFYKPGEAPEPLDKLAQIIREADCYVVVTAEYNHSIPPALKNMLDYFGGSNYAFKPSGIVSYSTGQWGGMRAAMSLRPILSELGCLPVSNLFGIPHVGSMGTVVAAHPWWRLQPKSMGRRKEHAAFGAGLAELPAVSCS
eukprot:jgi/Mesvir1/24596/Mv21915-RA.1